MKRIIIIIKTTMKKIRTLIPKRKLRKTVYVWVGHLLYHKLYHYGIRTNWVPWRAFICKLFNSWNSVTETPTSFVSIIFPKAKFSNWVLFRIVFFFLFYSFSSRRPLYFPRQNFHSCRDRFDADFFSLLFIKRIIRYWRELLYTN